MGTRVPRAPGKKTQKGAQLPAGPFPAPFPGRGPQSKLGWSTGVTGVQWPSEGTWTRRPEGGGAPPGGRRNRSICLVNILVQGSLYTQRTLGSFEVVEAEDALPQENRRETRTPLSVGQRIEDRETSGDLLDSDATHSGQEHRLHKA